MGSLLGKRKSPHLPRASLLTVYRLQRATRDLVEAVIFHTSSPLRELSVDPHTLPLLLPLSCFSNVSHLFLRVLLKEESIKPKVPAVSNGDGKHRLHMYCVKPRRDETLIVSLKHLHNVVLTKSQTVKVIKLSLSSCRILQVAFPARRSP